MVLIEDGTGSGSRAGITPSNRMKTVAITETQQERATNTGDSYNVNTGDISGIATEGSDNAVLYLKNNEDNDLIIVALAVGFGPGTAPSSAAANITIKLIRNPTTGSIISDASAVSMNANRNFGSSKTLDVDAYKGGDGKTFTNGDEIAQFYTSGGSRLFATIDFAIPKGKTVGVTIDPVGTGTFTIYAAFVCYLRDEENE